MAFHVSPSHERLLAGALPFSGVHIALQGFRPVLGSMSKLYIICSAQVWATAEMGDDEDIVAALLRNLQGEV